MNDSELLQLAKGWGNFVSDRIIIWRLRKEIDRGQVISYKEHLTKTYKISSINSMIVALNNYLNFIGKNECCVKTCRVQRQIFREESRALSKEEYLRLLEAAEKEKKFRLSCVIQTIASTGIRVGELSYITVESLKRRMAEIRFKGKSRIILIPDSLVHVLKRYCREAGIVSGCIFVTRKGVPVDRRNIWAEMKSLCKNANVDAKKIFPHNLRHLFALCFYKKKKDLVRLADYLGHSSVETTRRYTMLSRMETCLQELELGLSIPMGKKKYSMT